MAVHRCCLHIPVRGTDRHNLPDALEDEELSLTKCVSLAVLPAR